RVEGRDLIMPIEIAEIAGNRRRFGGLLLVAGLLAALPAIGGAFQEDEEKRDATEQEVVIKREVLKLTDPRTYKASMHLDAVRNLDLTAPVDGYVRTISVKPGQKLKAQGEAVRLDDARAALVVKRARANVQAAQVEKKLAQAKNDADLTALADARLEAAQAEFDLAHLEAEQLVVRGSFNGEIERVYVAEGQFVRAGEKLATLIDSSRLQAEVPIERGSAAVGSSIDIKVEESQVKARVESVTALPARFDALRELTVSPASAVVSIDNSAGKFFAGQTVYSDLIPLAPVALVPAGCISNVPDGGRKVKVLRDNVIRDLAVRILAKVGTESVFVSGRFNEGDEVIVGSSRELADGTPLRALAAKPSSAADGSSKPSSTNHPGAGKLPQSGKKPTTGF
ncbi:MAG: efflux RND transporter periplasmic adaptor subunit, partial [Deltaproteobacteria bacterium]